MKTLYRLVDTLYCFEDSEGGIFLGLPKENNLYFDNGKRLILDILEQFVEPNSIEDAIKELDSVGIDIAESGNEIVEMLCENNILKEFFPINNFLRNLSQKELTKYDRQIRHLASQPNSNYRKAIDYQKKLIDAHVLVIGIGGVGSHLCTGLASIGVGELTIVDFDEIELSNTSRQILYNEYDVGKSKLDIAKKRLLEINPEIKINDFNKEILNEHDLEAIKNDSISAVALCADKPIDKIQYYVDKFCQKNSYSCIYGGPFGQGNITLGPFIVPNKTKSYSEIFPNSERHTNDKRVKNINKHRISAIIDTDNAIAAKFMEVELIKYITKYSEVSTLHKQFMLDTKDWSMTCNEL